jgi:hypothetical protein
VLLLVALAMKMLRCSQTERKKFANWNELRTGDKARPTVQRTECLPFQHVSSSSQAWKVADVAEALGVSTRTIEHLKKRFVEEGLDAALVRKSRVGPPKTTFGGEFDARLAALACSPAPEGRARWTVRLLAEKVVELQIAPEVSLMTVQRSLKKTNCVLT